MSSSATPWSLADSAPVTPTSSFRTGTSDALAQKLRGFAARPQRSTPNRVNGNGQCVAILRKGRRGPYRGAVMPAGLDEPGDAASVAGERGEQLEHPGVVASRLARQRPRHGVREVEVADAHRIGVAEGDDGDLCRCPDADARDGLEPASELARVGRLLEPVGHRRGSADGLGSLAVRPRGDATSPR